MIYVKEDFIKLITKEFLKRKKKKKKKLRVLAIGRNPQPSDQYFRLSPLSFRRLVSNKAV